MGFCETSTMEASPEALIWVSDFLGFFTRFLAVLTKKRQGTAAVQDAGARFGSPLKIEHSRVVLDGIFPIRDGGSHLFGGVEVRLDEAGSKPWEGAEEV